MNLRIKLLAEQAHSESYEQYLLRQSKEGAANVIFYDMFNQKFAELIVKECGVALSPMLRDMVSRGQAYELIKQHLGVEE